MVRKPRNPVQTRDPRTSVYKYQCRRMSACKLLIVTRSSGLVARARWKKASCSGHSGGMRALTLTLDKDGEPAPDLDLLSLSSPHARWLSSESVPSASTKYTEHKKPGSCCS